MAAVPPLNPAPLNPAGLVRDVLAITGLSNTGNVNTRQTTRFANANGIVSIDDFALLDTAQVREMIKQYQKMAGSLPAGIKVQNNLQGLIWYARDMKRRNKAIDINNLNLDTLDASREDYQMYLKDLEASGKINEIEKFDLKKDFSDWDDSITVTLSRIMGSQEAGIHYVTRPDLPAGYVPLNSKEVLRYELPLNGRKFDKDNSLVFELLSASTLGTQAWTHVNEFKDQLNGRGAMIALRNHYDGDAENNKKMTKYQTIINTIQYHDERRATWENQINTLLKAYQWMETRADQTYTDDLKVLKLASMINVPNNNALNISVEFMKQNYRKDFKGALTYITTRINELNESKPSAGTRHISATQRKTRWNGVDISNPTREFQPNEWTKLKQEGQELVNQYRRDINQQRNQNNRNGRGGRNSGRGPGRGNRNNSNRNHGGYGYGGRGNHRGRHGGRGGSGRGGRRGRDDKNDERTIQEVEKDNDTKKPDDTNPKNNSSSTKGGSAGVLFK
jgi:hypothetical protein